MHYWTDSISLYLTFHFSRDLFKILPFNSPFPYLFPQHGILFGYLLPSFIFSEGDYMEDIKWRFGITKTAMTRLTRAWKDKSIIKATKKKLVHFIISSIFVYAAEMWLVLTSDYKKISAFEIWCWHRLLHIPWTTHCTNVCILREVNIMIDYLWKSTVRYC